MNRYDLGVDKIKDTHTNKLRYESMYYPKFEVKSTDVYFIAKAGDRMDLVAYDYYGDEKLWWVISRANVIPRGTLTLPPGFRIRVPFPLDIFDLESKLKEVQY